MKKRFISIILTLSIVMSMFSFPAYAYDLTCPYCGGSLQYSTTSLFFGNLEVVSAVCPDCDELFGTHAQYFYLSAGELLEFSAGDSAIIDEYYTSAYNGTGGSYETTTDDDGNTTTDYVANDSGTWYVDSSGNIVVQLDCYYRYSYYSPSYTYSSSCYPSNNYYSGSYSAVKNVLGSSIYFYYNIDTVPFTGYYIASISDDYYFYGLNSSGTVYTQSFDDLTLSSQSSSSGYIYATATDGYGKYYFKYASTVSSSSTSIDFFFYAPTMYLVYDYTLSESYVRSVFDSDSPDGYTDNSITVNGTAISGDYIYEVDYSSTDYSSNYSSAYYVYDNSDSGNYTVYNVDSSTGDVVSSYYYDNSTGDTITYMTIYYSDTFTEDEMYPTDTGDGDSTSSDSSGNAWTELFSDLFSGIADFIAAIISGVLELLIALVDELVSAVTSLLDTVTNLFTSVLDFGGEFSGFIGSFFDWMPDEIVVLLQLSIALPLLLMVIKFLINLFV